MRAGEKPRLREGHARDLGAQVFGQAKLGNFGVPEVVVILAQRLVLNGGVVQEVLEAVDAVLAGPASLPVVLRGTIRSVVPDHLKGGLGILVCPCKTKGL